VVSYDRFQLQRRAEDADEVTSDLAERRARRLAGAEPEMWKAPEPEPVKKATPAPNLLRLVEEVNAHTERRLLETAEMIGAELGKNDSVTRKSIEASATRVEDLLRAEMRQGFARNATELMRLRELREANQADLKLSLLDVRKELLEIREQIAELRGGMKPRAALNGGGAHADA
jgi:hypothetical protein